MWCPVPGVSLSWMWAAGVVMGQWDSSRTPVPAFASTGFPQVAILRACPIAAVPHQGLAGHAGRLPSRRSFTGAGSRDDGGSARPAVARSGVDERGGQDLAAAQGVVAARGLLACGGGIRCEQMSLAGTGVYYFHHSSRCHYLLSAKLAVSAHSAVSAFWWVRWSPRTPDTVGKLVQYRAADLANASADISKRAGQATAVGAGIRQMASAAFHQFSHSRAPRPRPQPRKLQLDTRMRHVMAQLCQEF